MKILLTNNLYFPYNKGGAENIVKMYEDYFTQKGDTVVVVTTRPWFCRKSLEENSKHYYLKSLYNLSNIMPLWLRFMRHSFEFVNFYPYIKLKKIINKEKPDLVITNNFKGLGIWLFPALAKGNFKHIHMLHDVQLLHPSGLIFKGREKVLDTMTAKTYQRFNKFFTSKIKYIISPSRWLLEEHVKKGFFVNAVKRTELNPAKFIKFESDRSFQETNIFKFIYVGLIESHKGVLDMIDTFSSLQIDKKWSLTIIGAGSLLEKAKFKVDKLGLSGSIFILGQLTNKDTVNYISKSDTLIVPSICYENSPTVIYEAAAQGVFAMVPNYGGAKELGEKFDYLLFSPLDKNDFLKKLIYLINNKNLISKKGQEAQIEIKNYSIENYFKNLENIL